MQRAGAGPEIAPGGPPPSKPVQSSDSARGTSYLDKLKAGLWRRVTGADPEGGTSPGSPDADDASTGATAVVCVGAGTYLGIFKTFGWLGWAAFGGPAAHIGLFQKVLCKHPNCISRTLSAYTAQAAANICMNTFCVGAPHTVL